MQLICLPVNAAWAFAWPDTTGQLVRMGDAGMFHETRKDAVSAANRVGLHVKRSGECITLDCHKCPGTCSNDLTEVHCGHRAPARVCGRHASYDLGDQSIYRTLHERLVGEGVVTM